MLNSECWASNEVVIQGTLLVSASFRFEYPWEVGKLNAALIILCSLSAQLNICPAKMAKS